LNLRAGSGCDAESDLQLFAVAAAMTFSDGRIHIAFQAGAKSFS
jgi:hypothetical protein